MIGPIVGGVVGAGAIAGVIAVSVLKTQKKNAAAIGSAEAAAAKSSGTPAPAGIVAGIDKPPAFRAKQAATQSATSAAATAVAAGPPTPAFKVAGNATLPTEAPATVSSGMTETTVIFVACGVAACLILCIAVGCLLHFFAGKNKKRKVRPTRDTYDPMPEDQQPLKKGIDMQETLTDLPGAESQYMQQSTYVQGGSVFGGMESQYMPVGPMQGIGSVETMQNVVPMQTMPPRPPMFSAPSSVYGGAPSSVYAQGPQSVYAQGPQSVYAQNSVQASPLANTMSALPTQQLYMPPTQYA